MTLKAYLNRFRSVKCLSHAMLWNAQDIVMALLPVLHVLWRNNMVGRLENTSWKPLETPFPRLNFNMSLDVSALKNLCLWCEFLSHLKFIISLPQCYGHALLFMICFISLVGILVIHRWYAYKSGEPAIGQNTFHVTHVCNARSLLQPVQCGWLKTVPWSQS